MVCPAHINCICPDIKKLPKRKLRYMREQRLRGEGGNSGFIHPLKINPNKKLKVESSDAGMNDESDNDPSDPSDTPYINERPTTSIHHPLTALAIMRHPDQSFRAASEIIAAYCMDKGYVSKEDTGDILDHVHLWREVQQVGQQLNEKAKQEILQTKPKSFSFDGKQNLTLGEKYIKGVRHPIKSKEDTYVLTYEPSGKLLSHFFVEKQKKVASADEVYLEDVEEEDENEDEDTEEDADETIDDTGEKQKEKVDPENTPSRRLGRKVVEELDKFGMRDFVEAVKVDSTPAMTGHDGGAVCTIEKSLNKPLYWLVCDAHTNELPPGKLLIELDGASKSKNKFKGEIGQKLHQLASLKIKEKFEAVAVGPGVEDIPKDILDQMSEDQKFAYQIYLDIRRGELSDEVRNNKLGEFSLARWVTLFSGVMLLYTRHHKMSPKATENLQMLVEYITGVYLPSFFYIKKHHQWQFGPDHVLFTLSLLKYQRPEVIQIVAPSIKSSSWYATSEHVLTRMLWSEVKSDRVFAVEMIVKKRNGALFGQQGYRQRSIFRRGNDLNPQATSLKNLLHWEKTRFFEPPLTLKMSTPDIEKLRDTPLVLPDYGSTHTQSTERCIQKISKVAKAVYTHERREMYVRANEVSAAVMRSNNSKRDLVKMLDIKLDE